jgi:uncharacterized protein involved in type VI secretion and phage assembly
MNAQEKTPDINTKRFHGSYRGKVVGNNDPEQMARVQVQVPDVLGKNSSSWAMPRVPVAGSQAGCFALPPEGSRVWVEFEQGDPDYPIWTGGFWDKGQVPDAAHTPLANAKGQNIVIQTTGQNMVVVSDSSPTAQGGGIVLSSGGATIVVNQSGIFISNGQGATITLMGPTVSINDQALQVT